MYLPKNAETLEESCIRFFHAAQYSISTKPWLQCFTGEIYWILLQEKISFNIISILLYATNKAKELL